MKNQEMFRSLFMSNPDPILLSRVSDGVIYLVNKGFASIFGYEEEELGEISKIEMGIWVDPMDRQKIYEKVKADGVVKNYESSFRKKNGDIIYGLVSASIIDFEDVPHIFVIARDITERKKAEEELIKSNKLLQRIIDLLPIRVFWKDNDLKFLGCNSIFATDAGENNAKDLIGKDDFQMIWKEQALSYQVDDKKVIDSGESKLNFIEPQTTPTGDIIWLKTSKVPLTGVQGEKIGILGIYENITKQKQAEDEIKKLNETLEQRVIERTTQLELSNKALEAFSHSVSHDLRAPLRAINGFSKLLESGFKDSLGAEGSRLVKVIVDNTVRMDSLIKCLVELSKVDQGTLKNERIDMNQLVQAVIQENISREDREKITFTTVTLDNIQGDPTLIKQVWVNLIENAVKYSRNKEHPTLSIQSFSQEEQVVYSVKDNGVGFNPAYQNRLFQMFQRLHNADEFPGTGIGLSIVKQIILRHGGKVWAEGEEGVGATFYFSLPNREEGK